MTIIVSFNCLKKKIIYSALYKRTNTVDIFIFFLCFFV